MNKKNNNEIEYIPYKYPTINTINTYKKTLYFILGYFLGYLTPIIITIITLK